MRNGPLVELSGTAGVVSPQDLNLYFLPKTGRDSYRELAEISHASIWTLCVLSRDDTQSIPHLPRYMRSRGLKGASARTPGAGMRDSRNGAGTEL